METGKVEGTSDVTIIGGETGKLEQGMTEIITETQDLEIMTETQKSKEGNELHEIKAEHTQVELGRDKGVELVECFVTQGEHQDNLPQEQGETVCSLELDCDQVSPVGPCEVTREHDAEGYVQSLGGGRDHGTP